MADAEAQAAEADLRTAGALLAILGAERRRAERKLEALGRAERKDTEGGMELTSSVAGWVTHEDGSEETISTADVLGYLHRELSNMLGSDVLEQTNLGGGLVRLDMHLDAPGGALSFDGDTTIPMATIGPHADGLRWDVPYFVLFGGDNEIPDARIMACEDGALVTTQRRAGDWSLPGIRLTDHHGEPATEGTVYLTERNEDGTTTEHTLGEAGLDPERLYAFYDSRAERYVTYFDLLGGLAILQASAGVAEEMREARRYRTLPRQDVRRLYRQSDPISKLALVMTNPALFHDDGASLDVAGKTEKRRGKDVNTAVAFSWDGEGVTIYRPISQWDREIHGAVSSLWADGQRNVTPHQIARAAGIRNPTKKQVEAVMESVDLQRRVMGRIDFTEEARGRTLVFEGEALTTFKLEGHLITADKAEIGTANGRVVEGYVMYRAPLIYQHAATLEQVVSYPQGLLELGEGRDTQQNIILRRELLRRVYRIKSNYAKARASKRHEVNRRIRFTSDAKHPGRSLFELAGVNQNNRDTRKKATDFLLGMLGELADHEVIADYKPITETGRGGRRTVGAEIIL